MPRRPTFVPKPVVRGGKETGKWRIVVYDRTRRGADGRMKRKDWLFDDLEEATAFGDELRAAYHAREAGLATVSPQDALRFQELEHRAAMLGYDSPEALMDAIEANPQFNEGGPSVREILDGYASHKRRRWANRRTRSTFETCRRPLQPMEHRKAGAISPKEWEDFFNDLREEGAAATSTFNRTIMYLRASYEHAIQVGLLNSNPVRGIEREAADLDRDPVIVKAPAIEKFLEHAVSHHIETVPYWVLCFFSGARPDSEALRVRWENILWHRDNRGGGQGEVWIPKPTRATERTKTFRERYVELEPVLRAWLELFRRESGFLAPCSSRTNTPSRTLIKEARQNIARGHYCPRGPDGELVALIEWGKENRDLTRHTYATAFVKAHAGEEGVNSRLKDNLGHGSEQTADRYYKNPHLEIGEAKKIFAIFPTEEQKEVIKSYMNKI